MSEEDHDFYDVDDEVSELSSSPTIPEGDIDFNFVYALHTFLATVEGQATSQKGDTLVLLDDSNSYWWLVRNVRDQTIGYLPAEHIETPPERLARLNKHRNVDNAGFQAHDYDPPANTTKLTSKFSLRKGRRTTSKAVTFSSPTLITYETFDSEEEYLSGDEDMATHDVGTDSGSTQGDTAAKSIDTNRLSNESNLALMQGNVADSSVTPVRQSRVYSLTPQPNEHNAKARSEQPVSDKLQTSPGSGTAHSHKESMSSFHSEVSAGSSTDDPESKEKRKKGVFSGLFKKRSKREKSKSAVLESTSIAARTQPGSSAPTEHVMLSSEADPASIIDLPQGVKEMRSSVLMDVDPATSDMIDQPAHRGPVDEVEMLHSHRLRSPTVPQLEDLVPGVTPSGTAPVEFVWTDSAINAYLLQHQTMHKNMMLMIGHQAGVEHDRHPERFSSPRIFEFDGVQSKVHNILKDLDDLLVT